MTQGLKVLVVCTANQCRSPMAEFLIKESVRRLGMDWQVSSAGTNALPGLPMHPKSAKLLRSRGIDIGDWRSRRVEGWMLDASELILTADRQHRSIIASSRPDLMPRTYPLLQFSAMAAAAQSNALWHPSRRQDRAALLEAVRSVQGKVQPLHDGVDLEDPIGRSYRRFRACAATIDEAISMMLGDGPPLPSTAHV